MHTASPWSDEQLVSDLLAPPDLDDGVRSLGFWRDRGRRLPWYRVAARREAARMAAEWERRVGAALVMQRDVPTALRLSAGLLIARSRFGRWARRARLALVAAAGFTAAFLALGAAAVLVSLLHALS